MPVMVSSPVVVTMVMVSVVASLDDDRPIVVMAVVVVMPSVVVAILDDDRPVVPAVVVAVVVFVALVALLAHGTHLLFDYEVRPYQVGFKAPF